MNDRLAAEENGTDKRGNQMGNHEAKILIAAKRARKAFAERLRVTFSDTYPYRTVDERWIKTSAGDTRLLVYRPLKTAGATPVFVNIHGGGFVQGSAEDDEIWCQRIADSVGCCVVSIDYHLSPEHKFPVALEECYDVVKWVHDQSAQLGADPARIAVGGHSAGGNLTAAICLLARERKEFSIVLQVLNYPPLDMSLDPFRHESKDMLLTPKVQAFFTACYVRTPEEAKNRLVSPLRAEDLSGLPPALMISAEYDPLREEEELYVRRLEEAGVPVKYECFQGCMHAFTHFGPEAAANDAWELIHARLRQAFCLR